ncbi:hypothetical protein BCR44DRAFT_1511368 [Catenaria anguillulae PL171]|uniref:Ankyrin repeat-containing domain protein n=1 Tax=Catenaria anguillulae PL171 TaxID=765915 RepID=A0A1Y2HU02_9FUNG|nr:hypothetical protein BCR44DRAFT_1511368 [Catenaria anguillulae PL171]
MESKAPYDAKWIRPHEDMLCALLKPDGDGDGAGAKRTVALVEMWVRHDACVLPYAEWELVIEASCEYGHVSVLDAIRECTPWWDDASPQVRAYTDMYVGDAVRGGQVRVLEWMVSTAGWRLETLVHHACAYGKVHVLEWYLANRARVDTDPEWEKKVEAQHAPYIKDELLLDLATDNGHDHVVQWLVEYYDPIVPLDRWSDVDGTSASGRLDVLKLWHARAAAGACAFPDYSKNALHFATAEGHLQILSWWIHESGWELKYDPDELFRCALCAKDWLQVVDWWMNESGIKFDMDQLVGILSKCDTRTLTMLDRWQQAGSLAFPCNVSKALCNAARESRVDVLEWWQTRSGVKLEFDQGLMDAACHGASTHYLSLAMLEWQGRCREMVARRIDESQLPVRYTADFLRKVVSVESEYPARAQHLVSWMIAKVLDLKLDEDAWKRDDGTLMFEELEEYFRIRG